MTESLKQHDYFPNPMHMGDCAVCGNVREASIHTGFREAKPVKLVPAPTVEQAIRDSCAGVLREALVRAEAGEMLGLILLTKDSDGLWSHTSTASISIREDIGAIEMFKWDRMYRTRVRRGE